jgi:alkylation response protein AidB-like acyl-CoA dehydrogenase
MAPERLGATMDFNLTAEQRSLCRALAEAGERLNDGLPERERTGGFHLEAWRLAAAAGLHGLPLPREYGGGGADVLTTALGLEAFSAACQDEGLTFSVCAHMQSCMVPIWLHGNEEQKRRFLSGLASGALVGGNGTTEPDSGSDAFSMRTTAVREGDDYVLRGTKMYVTNGPVADVLLIYALTSPEDRQFGGISAFLVEKGTSGLHAGPNFEKIGLRTAAWCEVTLDACRVPVANRLGEEGAGAAMFTESMEWERLLVSFASLGRLAYTLDRCLTYARRRRQFGKAIGKFQAIANKLVQMKADLETSRLLLYKAAWLRDQGERAGLEISLAKYLVNESRIRSAVDAIQIHGASGCTTELHLERELRNALPLSIASGTSEIQKMIAARLLGL